MLVLPVLLVGGGLVVILERMRRRNPTGVELVRAGLGVVLTSLLIMGIASYVFSYSMDPSLPPDRRPTFESTRWVVVCGVSALVGIAIGSVGVRRWWLSLPDRPPT